MLFFFSWLCHLSVGVWNLILRTHARYRRLLCFFIYGNSVLVSRQKLFSPYSTSHSCFTARVYSYCLCDTCHYRFYNSPKPVFLFVFLSNCLFFVLYLVLRKTVFYTPHLDYQASAGHFMSSVFQPNFPWALYLKQLAMTLTLFYLYLLIILYKKWNKMEINGLYLFKFCFFFCRSMSSVIWPATVPIAAVIFTCCLRFSFL